MVRRRRPVQCLQDLIDRCTVVPAGCWLWDGALPPGRQPKLEIAAGVVDGLRAGVYPVRRVAWALAGRPLEPGLIVFQAGCTSRHCVAPAHSRMGTFNDRGREQRRDGRMRIVAPARVVAHARGTKRNPLIAPREVVQQVAQELAAGRSEGDVATAFGMHRDTVRTIAAGRHLHQRQGCIASASVFGAQGGGEG